MISTDSFDDDVETIHQLETRLHEFVEKDLRIIDTEDSSCEQLPAIVPDLPTHHQPHAYPCSDSFQRMPAPPSQWPQAPMMLRPTPGSKTRIRGMRYMNSEEYRHFGGFCSGCILPINNGEEEVPLVIDFESPLFVGTLMLRLREIPSINGVAATTTDKSYFEGRKRRFQAVVRGRFRKEVPISSCVTGQTFDRPAGKLPAPWMVRSIIRFVSVLSPQLEASLDGENPRFLSPLASTAQTVLVNDKSSFESLEEPPAGDLSSLVPEQPQSRDTVGSRIKQRKKHFNRITASKAPTPVFSPEKEYTFEFFQHLLRFHDPNELHLDIGSAQIGLARSLNGQPLKFMAAAHEDETLTTLWSFDLWHSSLYSYAQTALGSYQQMKDQN